MPVQAASAGDYILVLGGAMRSVEAQNGEYIYEFNEASDRFFAGMALYNEKKAPKIIFARAVLPWSVGKPEGEILETLAIEFGIPQSDILLTPPVENTAEEAQAIADMTPQGSEIILVTSAYHMPRARGQFEAAGVDITPFATDYRQSSSQLSMLDFLPSAGALAQTSLFVREMLGRIYYWVFG